MLGQGESDVAMDHDGDFVIAYSSYGQDGSSFGVYGQRYNAAGVPEDQQFQANSATALSQRLPAVAMDATGNVAISWNGEGQDGSGYGVYAQRYAVATCPAITASQFVWDSAAQHIDFKFDQDVSASLTSSDFVLANLTTQTTISSAGIVVSWNGTLKRATLTFPALPNGSLPDGDYRVTVPGAGVTNAIGTPLIVDYTFDFFSLAGDADHDRDVDVNDLGILATNWQQSPRTFSQGDFDYSGTVDVNDLGILASHWQQGLPATSAPAASSQPPQLSRSIKLIEPQSSADMVLN